MQSSFSTDTFGELSLFSVMVNLITGGDKYNPTAVSIIMSPPAAPQRLQPLKQLAAQRVQARAALRSARKNGRRAHFHNCIRCTSSSSPFTSFKHTNFNICNLQMQHNLSVCIKNIFNKAELPQTKTPSNYYLHSVLCCKILI